MIVGALSGWGSSQWLAVCCAHCVVNLNIENRDFFSNGIIYARGVNRTKYPYIYSSNMTIKMYQIQILSCLHVCTWII